MKISTLSGYKIFVNSLFKQDNVITFSSLHSTQMEYVDTFCINTSCSWIPQSKNGISND